MNSGDVPSRLISPKTEQTLKTYEELDLNNYSAAVYG